MTNHNPLHASSFFPLLYDPDLRVHAAAAKLAKFAPVYCRLLDALDSGVLQQGGRVIEAPATLDTAFAHALAARYLGLELTLVLDQDQAPWMDGLMALGAEVVVVPQPPASHFACQARQKAVDQVRTQDPSVFFPAMSYSAYHSAGYAEDARRICRAFAGAGEELAAFDILVVPVNMGALARGFSRILRGLSPDLEVVAVAGAGTSLFGNRPEGPTLPGFDNPIPTRILDHRQFDRVHLWPAVDAVAAASVLATEQELQVDAASAAAWWSARHEARRSPSYRVLALMPNRGDLYMDRIRDPHWVTRAGLSRNRRPTAPRCVPVSTAPVAAWSVMDWDRRPLGAVATHPRSVAPDPGARLMGSLVNTIRPTDPPTVVESLEASSPAFRNLRIGGRRIDRRRPVRGDGPPTRGRGLRRETVVRGARVDIDDSSEN